MSATLRDNREDTLGDKTAKEIYTEITSLSTTLHFSQVQLEPLSTTFFWQPAVVQEVYHGSASLCLMKFTYALTVEKSPFSEAPMPVSLMRDSATRLSMGSVAPLLSRPVQ
jgi:hypothetical protein